MFGTECVQIQVSPAFKLFICSRRAGTPSMRCRKSWMRSQGLCDELRAARNQRTREPMKRGVFCGDERWFIVMSDDYIWHHGDLQLFYAILSCGWVTHDSWLMNMYVYHI